MPLFIPIPDHKWLSGLSWWIGIEWKVCRCALSELRISIRAVRECGVCSTLLHNDLSPFSCTLRLSLFSLFQMCAGHTVVNHSRSQCFLIDSSFALRTHHKRNVAQPRVLLPLVLSLLGSLLTYSELFSGVLQYVKNYWQNSRKFALNIYGPQRISPNNFGIIEAKNSNCVGNI